MHKKIQGTEYLKSRCSVIEFQSKAIHTSDYNCFEI